MPSTSHRLFISGPAGAVFRVTDGTSRCIATGMYRLDLQLPLGIYTVSATLGRSVETQEVLLDQSRQLRFDTQVPSFGDRAFGIAPDVLAALDPGTWAGGQLVALRGPWRDKAAARSGAVMLARDGQAITARAQGLVRDPDGASLWSWQLFDLTPPAREQDLGALTLTRSVSPPARSGAGPAAEPAETSDEDSIQRVSHAVPDWREWTLWAAYPATLDAATDAPLLPTQHYVRLRLTQPGAAPVMKLQSLSDQIFTTLAARTALPLSKPVLDLLLKGDEVDPLLALAAAHVASISLGWLRHVQPWPQDVARTEVPGAVDELRLAYEPGLQAPGGPDDPVFEPETVQQMFATWLHAQAQNGLAGSPDLVAARFLLGIDGRAHLRVPPVLLRSLDGLMAAAATSESRAAEVTCEDSVWAQRFQLSESFAFLQWDPDADYQQQMRERLEMSLHSAQAMQASASQLTQDIQRSAAARRPVAPERAAGAARAMAAPAPTPTPPAALDLLEFIKGNAAHLRIPESALPQFGAILQELQLDQAGVDDSLRQLSARLRKK